MHFFLLRLSVKNFTSLKISKIETRFFEKRFNNWAYFSMCAVIFQKVGDEEKKLRNKSART